MTPEELYNTSVEKINKTTIQNEIVDEIQTVTDALVTKNMGQWTGDDISRALAKISVLRVNLGVAMVDAMAMYDFSYINRKFQYSNEWKAQKIKLNKMMEKVTVGDIEAEVQEKIQQTIVEENEKKHYGERLRILYDATGTLISALQSRLSLIKSEKQETAYYSK